MAPPLFPGALRQPQTFFYYSCSVLLAVGPPSVLRWLYSRRFGLAINAIRDDEDKAEAMGLHTTRYKVFAWCVAALFLGLPAGRGNLVGFIDPRELAFAGATFGVWMVLMAILGGKGTLWGPVVGAAVFHVTQGTVLDVPPRVAAGGAGRADRRHRDSSRPASAGRCERWPERFGHRVEPATQEASP